MNIKDSYLHAGIHVVKNILFSIANSGNNNGKLVATITWAEDGSTNTEIAIPISGATFGSQTKNTVFAAPNGSNGNPSFRALVAADIPNISANKITSDTLSADRLPLASNTAKGAVLLGVAQTSDADSAITGKKYWVKMNTSGKLFIDVPWNDNTHYTAIPVLGATTATSNATSDTANNATFLNIVENSTKSGGILIIGSGATTVKANNGVLTINSTNTWNAMTGATSSANGTVGYVNAAPPKDGYNTKFLRADGTWSVPAYPTKASWNYDDVYLKLSGGSITGKLSIKKDLGGNLTDYITYLHQGPLEVGRATNAMCVAIGVTDDNYGYIQVKGLNITTPGNLVLLPGGGNLYKGSTGIKILDSNNSSVSKSGETLSVKINDTTQSLTNTWRGIQNNLTSDSTTDSLSAALGKVLNDKFDNYVPKIAGTGSVVATLNSFKDWNGVKIKIPGGYNPWMVIFTLRIMYDYRYTDIVISGYHYGGNHWYQPNAKCIGGTTNFRIVMGYEGDTANNLYVWFGPSSGALTYGGVTIMNLHGGHTTLPDWYSGWTFSNVAYENLTNKLYDTTVSSPSLDGHTHTWDSITSKPAALGSATLPVYWNGSGFTLANAYPTKSSWNYDDVYVKKVGSVMTGHLYLKGSANLITNSVGGYANGIRVNRAGLDKWAGITIGYVSANLESGASGYDANTWMIATPINSNYLNISVNGNVSTGVGLTLKGSGNNDIIWNNNTVYHAGNIPSNTKDAAGIVAKGVASSVYMTDSTGAPSWTEYDTTVTSGSGKLITSGAVYTAIANNVASAVQYLGTITSQAEMIALTSAGQGDFARVTTAFTFTDATGASVTAHVGDIVYLTNNTPGTASNWIVAHTEIDTNTWTAASTSAAGYIPKLVTGGANLAAASTDYVLSYINGATTPQWLKLPANAYKDTWIAWTGATDSVAGTAGYMPGAAIADRTKFLRGDGSWVALSLIDHTHSVKINGGTKTIAASGGTAVDLGNYPTLYTYSLTYLKGVRISYVLGPPVLVSAHLNNGGSKLILIGHGYGAQAWIRNLWRAILSNTSFKWSLPNSESISTSVEIFNNNSSGEALIHVWSSGNITFTLIDKLTTAAVTNQTLLTASMVSNSAATIGTTATTIATIGGVNITAKIGSYAASDHTHSVSINGLTKTIAAPGGTAVDLGSYLPLSGGTISGTVSGSGLSYGGGGFNRNYANIIFRGNETTGTSGLIFTAYKGDTLIIANNTTDCAFILYHPCGLSAATASGTDPTILTSGEAGRFVIGIANDVGDQVWLQTPSVNDLKHVVGANVYQIASSGNITNKAAVIGTTATTLATIAGVNITASLPTAARGESTVTSGVITPTSSGTTKFLREDGTWQTPAYTADTVRPVYTGGTSRYDASTKTGINFVAAGATTITFETAGTDTGQSGSTNYGNIKISSANDLVKFSAITANTNYYLPVRAYNTTDIAQLLYRSAIVVNGTTITASLSGNATTATNLLTTSRGFLYVNANNTVSYTSYGTRDTSKIGIPYIHHTSDSNDIYVLGEDLFYKSGNDKYIGDAIRSKNFANFKTTTVSTDDWSGSSTSGSQSGSGTTTYSAGDGVAINNGVISVTRKEWYGTEALFNALSSLDNNTTYYIMA